MGNGSARIRKIAMISAVLVLVPTAAYAAAGAFDTSGGTPALTATNSSSATGTKAIEGRQTGGGAKTRYGVLGTANGAGGVGVIGTGTRDGVYSNGPLGVRAGSTLDCTGCVSVTDLSSDARAPQVLPSGQSESGAFGAGGGNGTGGHIGEGITFVRPLAHAIDNSNIVDATTWPRTHCAGPGLADTGYLCLYEAVTNDVGTGYGYSTALMTDGESVGVILFWPEAGSGASYAGGVYTVTAP